MNSRAFICAWWQAVAMTWKTQGVSSERWSVVLDATLPIAIVTVKGIPTADDAIAMTACTTAFAKEVGGKPWAILSDLREMTIAGTASREVWIESMKHNIAMGLRRWGVVNSRQTAMFQSKHVAEEAAVRDITHLTFDYADADAWVRAIVKPNS